MKHIFRASIALITFAVGIGMVLEYQYLSAFFRSPSRAPATSALVGVAVPRNGDIDRSVLNGSYQLFGEIESPGFKDFRSIDIVTHDYRAKDDEFVPAQLRGSINAAARYEISSSSITPYFSNGYTRTVIRFETAAINGVSYMFIGTITQPNDLQNIDERTDFRGKLVKSKNGTVMASMEGAFYLTACRTNEKRAHYLCPYDS